MRNIILAGALSLAAISLASCGRLNTQIATQTPVQISSLAEAIQATTLADITADTIVQSAKLPSATLQQGSALAAAVHTELQKLEAAQAAGQSLVFTAFDNALTALQQYEIANKAVPPTASATAPSA